MLRKECKKAERGSNEFVCTSIYCGVNMLLLQIVQQSIERLGAMQYEVGSNRSLTAKKSQYQGPILRRPMENNWLISKMSARLNIV